MQNRCRAVEFLLVAVENTPYLPWCFLPFRRLPEESRRLEWPGPCNSAVKAIPPAHGAICERGACPLPGPSVLDPPREHDHCRAWWGRLERGPVAQRGPAATDRGDHADRCSVPNGTSLGALLFFAGLFLKSQVSLAERVGCSRLETSPGGPSETCSLTKMFGGRYSFVTCRDCRTPKNGVLKFEALLSALETSAKVSCRGV